jgi:histone H3/H4
MVDESLEPQNQQNQSEEAKELEDSAEEEEGLPFPRARVVKLLREEIKDKIIRSEVKDAMNIWLGELTKKIAKEMGATQYASVSLIDFQRATKPYDMIEDIIKDEQRLLLSVQKLREDADHINRELARFFAVLKGKRPEEQTV